MYSRFVFGICLAVSLNAMQAHARAALVYQYELNGSLADTAPPAGPSLLQDGGILGPSNYTFGANQGLNLPNAMGGISGNYSIVIDFSFSSTSGYRKILDFKDRASDGGLYNLNGNLIFYQGSGSGAGVILPGSQVRVTLTRDSGSGDVSGYLGSVLQWTFNDSGSVAVFDAANNIARFFEDDFATSQQESSAGQVDRILIYDVALTQPEISQLPPPGLAGDVAVPEPASLVVWGLGVLGCAVGAARRRKLV